MSLEALFCDVDNFCQRFLPSWQPEQLTHGERRRRCSGQLLGSETMAISILFHQSHYRHSKAYYLGYVRRHLRELSLDE